MLTAFMKTPLCRLRTDPVLTATRQSWVLRRAAEGVAEEARTRGFASLTLVRFVFVRIIMNRHSGMRSEAAVQELRPMRITGIRRHAKGAAYAR